MNRMLIGLLTLLLIIAAAGLCNAAGDNYFPINLKPFCNMGFVDETPEDLKGGWTDQGPGNDLRHFPTGIRDFAGVPFNIIDPGQNAGKSCIMLRGSHRRYFLPEVAIPIKRKATVFYFLHAGAWGSGDGTMYILRYADGTQAVKELVNKINIADWAEPAPLAEARLAWQGRSMSNPVGVWMMQWDNPYPEKVISSLVLKSKGIGALTGVIGITGATEKKAAAAVAKIEGVIKVDRINYPKGQPVAGSIRIKNRSAEMIPGRLLFAVVGTAGEVCRQYYDFYPGPAQDDVRQQCHPDELWDVNFSLPLNLTPGKYQLKSWFEVKKPGGGNAELIELDHVTCNADATSVAISQSEKNVPAGIVSVDKYWFFRDEPVSGNIRLKGINEGQIWICVSIGGKQLSRQAYELSAEAGGARSIKFSLPGELPEGLYQVEVMLENNNQLSHLDHTPFAAMGRRPSKPLSAENFLTYSEPLHLMIGYVHDEATLRAQFKELRAKGFDLVAIEWFWEMVNRDSAKPINLDYTKKVADIANEYGLKLWMYYGLWNYFPPYAAKVLNAEGKEENALDVMDPVTRRELIRLYEETAFQLKSNPNVVGYTVRLHPNHYRSFSEPCRKEWERYLKDNGYDTREKQQKLGLAFDTAGRPQIPHPSVSNSLSTLKLWKVFLRFEEQMLLDVIEDLCKAIRRHDKNKVIRLNLAQSHEASTNECPGFQQIGFYRLAEKYNGVINQECFEFPIHSAKEPELSRIYQVGLTTEGGGVPMARPGIAALMFHAIAHNVAYVAYCHNLVRNNLFEWFRYKPFWKIRKQYGARLNDNLILTSFWRDSWVGDNLRGPYFQYHFSYNILLDGSNYAYGMVNEDLLHRGKVKPGNVLFDTNSFYIGTETAQDIRKFINDGGTFVANHLTGYNAWDGGEKYMLLNKYLGVKIKGERHEPVKCAGQTLSARQGIALASRPGDEIIARWRDGQPAALMRRNGRGKVLVIGFSVNADDFGNGVMNRIMTQAGVNRHLISEQCQEAMLTKDAQGNYFTGAFNGKSDATVAILTLNGLKSGEKYNVINLMTRKNVKTKVSPGGALRIKLPIEPNGCSFAEIRRMTTTEATK